MVQAWFAHRLRRPQNAPHSTSNEEREARRGGARADPASPAGARDRPSLSGRTLSTFRGQRGEDGVLGPRSSHVLQDLRHRGGRRAGGQHHALLSLGAHPWRRRREHWPGVHLSLGADRSSRPDSSHAPAARPAAPSGAAQLWPSLRATPRLGTAGFRSTSTSVSPRNLAAHLHRPGTLLPAPEPPLPQHFRFRSELRPTPLVRRASGLLGLGLSARAHPFLKGRHP